MPPISDDLIDPELLGTALDPATAFFNQQRTQRELAQEDPDNASESGSPDDLDNVAPYMSHSTPDADFARSLNAFGRLVKQQKKFNDSTEAEFDAYCKTHDVEERMALQFAVTLETRDLLKDMQREEHWVIPEDLKKNIARYAKAFILSPAVTAYKGNAPEQILKLMRECKVRDLPAEKRLVETAQVLSTIGGILTTYRNTTKTTIIASLDREKTGSDVGIRNIADLTAAIIASTNTDATLQLYMRVAFLRWVAIQYEKIGEAYWTKVDEILEQWRKGASTALELTEMFNRIYREDIARFGDPAETSHKVVAPNNVPDWVLTVDRFAGGVEAIAGGKTKRKRRTK